MAEIQITETKNKRTAVADGEIFYSNGTSEKIEYGTAEIAVRAYMANNDVVRAVLPESVEKINDSAFFHCLNLESVTLPESISEICFSAFSNCTSLKSIRLPSFLKKIGSFAFGSTPITEIYIPDTVEEIESYAFFSCVELKKIYLPASVKIIDDSAFSHCTVAAVYYAGSEADWYGINAETVYNSAPSEIFSSADIHFNCTREQYETAKAPEVRSTEAKKEEVQKAQNNIFKTIKSFLQKNKS